MKKFTDTQKKWALTATMIAALGCSVSFNSHTNGFASLDLASESDGHKLIQLPTSKGMLDVHLIATGDKTTAVTSPAKDSEGKASFECGDCSKTIVLDKKITDNVSDIQVALMAELVKAPAAKKEVVKEASVVEEESENRGRRKRADDDSEERRERNSDRRKSSLTSREQRDLLYADGDKSCVKDGDEKFSGVKQSKCYAKAFVASLKKTEIDPIIAIHYYKKEIEPSLVTEIARGTFYDEFGLQTENKGLEVVSDLMKDVPEDQISLKEQLVFTSTQALNKRAAAVRNSINSSRTANGGISRAALVKYQDLLATSQILYQSNNDMIIGAVDSNVGQIILENAYVQPSTQIIGSLPQLGNQPQFLNGRQINPQQIAGVVPAPGYNQQNGRTVYGNQTQYQLQAPNSFALDGMSPAGVIAQNQLQPVYENGQLIAPTADQVINSNQQAIVVLPQNTSNGVQFGQPRSVSQQALQEAQRIRAQQGQRIWVQQ